MAQAISSSFPGPLYLLTQAVSTCANAGRTASKTMPIAGDRTKQKRLNIKPPFLESVSFPEILLGEIYSQKEEKTRRIL
jgi:hypothetical protein